MKSAVQKFVDRIASWPEEDLKTLEDAARQIEAWRSGTYEATADELRAIDEGIAELDRGETATPEEVRAAFAAFHAA